MQENKMCHIMFCQFNPGCPLPSATGRSNGLVLKLSVSKLRVDGDWVAWMTALQRTL